MKKQLKEEWRDIPEYEGIYQVSNFGRVKSLDRFILQKYSMNPNRIIKVFHKSKILKPQTNLQGYSIVNLYYKNHKFRSERISRLVLTTFNLFPKKGEQASHYPDQDKSNNKLDNLRWETPKKK
mgnify:CR=1 FL=1